MSVLALTPRVREALGVSSSYDSETIPALIRRSIKRLLRDYHFPKSLVRTDYTPLALGATTVALPAGFKKEYLVQFYDAATTAWSEPLFKAEGFRRPQSNGFPGFYWMQGTNLVFDTPIPLSMTGYTLQLYSETWDVETHENWVSEDFEDVLYYLSVFRGAAEMNKPEVMKTFERLWMEEQQSLAVYLNELEFDGLYMQMREPRNAIVERYPKS